MVVCGIKVCSRWEGKDGFRNFFSDIGPRPNDGQKWTLDRIDNNGNYEPGNCRWSTLSEQSSNRRMTDKWRAAQGNKESNRDKATGQFIKKK